MIAPKLCSKSLHDDFCIPDLFLATILICHSGISLIVQKSVHLAEHQLILFKMTFHHIVCCIEFPALFAQPSSNRIRIFLQTLEYYVDKVQKLLWGLLGHNCMQCDFWFFFHTSSSSLWGNTSFSTCLSLLPIGVMGTQVMRSSHEKIRKIKPEFWHISFYKLFSDIMLYLFFNCWFTPCPASPLCILLLLIRLYSTIPFAVFFQCVLVFVVKISSCIEMKNDSASPKGAVSSSNLSLRNFRKMCHSASETLERAFKAILEKCENKRKCECRVRERFA